mgnify:FL=1
MKLEKSMRAELGYIAVGLAICDALVCGVFAALGKFDYTVVLGALWGSVFAFLGMYLLARRVQKLSDMENEQAQQTAKGQLTASYYGRIMLMVFAVVVGVIAPCFQYIAVVVPFLAPQPVMLLRRALTRRKNQGSPDTEPKDA